MTAPKELHERIDRLSPEALRRVAEVVENEERIQRHLEALAAFQEGWTPEEQAAWDEGTRRRPWRTVPLENES
ncbi:hypothetical protein DAERI_030331 [Deinococcus aerius]|uniref:Uncharacterized protein n=1 Tax=Deinococcus aerius TaxID=200253 RepID=A0A2I9DX09_9DEIO|nr:hypothetical protein [Deinococcus aerius]GBF05165.1 hypothetical protein DAERI_030331 [Deinococcus aerius]